ncbi:MAG: RNA polymerase sigma factor [Pyrinomonadaceae bacterium]
MNRNWVLTQESFTALLAWLHSDVETAAGIYEEIRRRLIRIFISRGCAEAEDLADETMNRVAKRLSNLEYGVDDDRVRYFYGVANKLYLEYLRRKPAAVLAPAPLDDEETEHRLSCLEYCMDQLAPEHRDLVLAYYEEEKKARIDHRKLLAERLGLAPNALRIRAFRIRSQLCECVERCLRAQNS